jgi:hypothetical protein
LSHDLATMGRDRTHQATPDLFSTDMARDASPPPTRRVSATEAATDTALKRHVLPSDLPNAVKYLTDMELDLLITACPYGFDAFPPYETTKSLPQGGDRAFRRCGHAGVLGRFGCNSYHRILQPECPAVISSLASFSHRDTHVFSFASRRRTPTPFSHPIGICQTAVQSATV